MEGLDFAYASSSPRLPICSGIADGLLRVSAKPKLGIWGWSEFPTALAGMFMAGTAELMAYWFEAWLWGG